MSRITYFLIILLLTFNNILLSGDVDVKKEYGFVGTKACKKCHIKQYKSWAKTNMSRAYDILKPNERTEAKKKVGLDPEKDYTKDSECLPCHTTGYGRPGGFINSEETPQLVGISCESCHGAGKEYTKKQYMHSKNKEYKRVDIVKVGLVSPVTSERCTASCHNEKSPFFNKDEPFDFKRR
ncbi:MAG: cytochrome c family protein, partial [Desulfobulbaceae bacterium]|nr:cytochrome c family protein [Desulfobulbaceae bacterium]